MAEVLRYTEAMISVSYETYLYKKGWVVNDKTVLYPELIKALSNDSIKKLFKMEFDTDVDDAFIHQLRNPSDDNLEMIVGKQDDE